MNHPASPIAPSVDVPPDVIHAFTRDRFVDMFLSQNRRAQIGLLVAAALVTVLWLQSAAWDWPPWAWLAAVLLVVVWRYLCTEDFVRSGDESSRDHRVVLVLFLNGVLMAIPVAGFHGYSEMQRAAITIVLIGSATASVATTSGFRSVFIAFAAPMLLSLSIAWGSVAWTSGAAAAWSMSLLTSIYLLFLVGIGRQASTVFEEICRYRHGEEQRNQTLAHALEAASEANHAKTRFLAAASHDLRQPIHSMNVLVAALGMRDLEPRAREIANLLGSVNQILSGQLDALLDISKLDAGVLSPSLGTHRLDLLVQTHHAAMAPVAYERDIVMTLDHTEMVYVRTDAALLVRALSNLTDNALKYTPRGGAVTLSVFGGDDYAVLRVADTGVGIPANEHERVFREFYQVGNVERDRLKGLGLGLAIVRRLCALLQIGLNLQSAPGSGTTVELRLPLAEPDQPRTAQPVRAKLPPGLHVLVVDDEAMVRNSMRLLLTEMGCQVYLATSSEEARQIAASMPVDVVLTDMRLGKYDSGLQVIQDVRAQRTGVRAVLITGDTAPECLREAHAAGVPLLHKPVTLNDLSGALDTSPTT